MSLNLHAIQVALNAHLQTLLSQPPAIPVIFENQEFPDRDLFTRATLTTNEPVPAGIGTTAKNRIDGIFLVDIFRKQRTGKGGAAQLADRIANHFKRGTVIPAGSVNIRVSSAGPTTGILEGNHFHLPVIIRFFFYFENN